MISTRTLVVGGMFILVLNALFAAQSALLRVAAKQPGVQAPRFEVDPFWPKPLPNHWVLGNAIGVWVDEQDVVWIINRGSATLAANEKALELKTGDCCAGAPPVLAYDASGTLVRHWGGPGAGYDWPDSNHGIFVDHLGAVWIGGNGPGDSHILKFTQGRQVSRRSSASRPRARIGQERPGTADLCRRQQRSRQLWPRREDHGRRENQRSVYRRRISEQARRRARRENGRDEALLGRVRQQARRHAIPVRTCPMRRPPNSSAIPSTAPICQTTDSSTCATVSTIGCRCFDRTARS